MLSPVVLWRRLRWHRQTWMLVVALFAASLFTLAAGTSDKAHADPCFFSQTQFDEWLSEYGNSYHDPTYAGWGDSLSRVQNVFAGGCAGSWGSRLLPSYDCGIPDPVVWRVWAQSDGDKTMIAFRDRGVGSSPRYVARCQAGTQKPDGSWRFHFWEP